MVGKAKSNISLAATVRYNMKKGSSFFYSNKLEGDEISSFKWQMTDLQKCYDGPGKSLIVHAQLSPEPEDGKRLEEES